MVRAKKPKLNLVRLELHQDRWEIRGKLSRWVGNHVIGEGQVADLINIIACRANRISCPEARRRSG